MKLRAMGLIACVALASCGKSDVDLKNASVDDVVKATASSKTLNPGQWSVQTEVVSVDLPGMPAQEKQMMQAMTKAMVGKKNITESCLSKEQAEKPPTEMLSGKAGAACKFETFTIDDGEMHAVMKCSDPKGGAGGMTMKMQGQYGGDSYNINSEMTMSGMPGSPTGAAMTIVSRGTGKRTGECKAS